MSTGVFATLETRLAGEGREVSISHGMPVVDLRPEAVLATVDELKSGLGFDLLLDVTAVDWPRRTPRFDVVWHFYSTVHRLRLRLRTRVPEADPVVDTLTGLYGSARFMERECHEMYGIVFRGNFDLRPILLYEGFEGYPLRKDYPKRREQWLIPERRQGEDS